MCNEICKYYDEDEGCLFYAMGSGYEHDMPCYRDDEDDVMPSNDQVNAKWILTKDRFPDEECNCLVTVKEWYKEPYVMIARFYKSFYSCGKTFYNKFVKNGDELLVGLAECGSKVLTNTVTAWMPLIEPYKE